MRNLVHAAAAGLEQSSSLHVMLHGLRPIMRHLPGDAPHITFEHGLWFARCMRADVGIAHLPDLALRTLLQRITPQHGKSRPLMAPVGPFHVTENRHVPEATTLRHAG